VDYFAEEIASQQAALGNKGASGSEDSAGLVRESLSSSQLQETIRRSYGSPSQWSVFPEFIVPTSTYLHGLYFLANARTSSDYERAATSLRRVAEMVPQSEVLARDAHWASTRAQGRPNASTTAEVTGPQVWVLYENGLGPVLREERFDVPLVLYHDNQQLPAYTGIALPQYVSRAPVPGNLVISDAAGNSVRTERIADMGRVFRTEMKERFPGILARALSSAVTKALIQSEAAEQFGTVGLLGSAAFALVTTQADLRGWQALPDHWQAARIERPDTGRLTLNGGDGRHLGSVTVPEQPFTIIYIKEPTASAGATVMIIDLEGNQRATVLEFPVATAAFRASGTN
jgi:hypothetical protein